MFSKMRKHFNIIIVFMIIYLVLMLVVLIGEKAFYNSVCKDKEMSINAETKNTKSFINELVSEASNNILLFEKTLIEDQASMTSDIMEKVFNDVNAKGSVFELSNILLYSRENEYYNYQNKGVKGSFNVNDLAWVIEGEEYYNTKVSYFYDEDLGENYLVVSQKVLTDDMIIAMCYRSESVSENVFVGQEGNCYLMSNEGKVVLANDSLNIGQDAFEKDIVLKSDNSIYTNTKNDTKEYKVGKNSYFVSISELTQDHCFVYIIDNKDEMKVAKGWFYRNLIFYIFMTIIVVLGLIKAVVSEDKIKNMVNSKCELLTTIADEVKKSLATIDESAKYIIFESSNEAFITKANAIIDTNKSIGFTMDNAMTYAAMFKEDFENEKGEYTAIELMNEVQAIVSSTLKKKNIYMDVDVQADERLKFYGDKKQITAAIVNLISYSIDKTYQGGIDIVATCEEIFADKTKFIVKIKDTSSGMEDNEASELQEKMNGKVKKVKLEDAGLGLEMVNMVINNLKGRLDISSTKNVGSEYVLRLPVVALLNTDESFIREQREKKEKAIEEELNNSFWSGVETKAKTQDNSGLSMSDMGVDNSGLSMSDMGADNSGLSMSDMGEDNSGLSMSDMGASNAGLSMSDMGESQVAQDNSYMNNMAQNNMQMSQMNMDQGQMNQMAMNQSVMNNGQMSNDMINNQAESDLQMLNDDTLDVNNGVSNNNEDSGEEAKDLNSISMDEMNKKYIEMMSARNTSYEEETRVENEQPQQAQASPYYQTDTINSMRLNTLYVEDNNEVKEDNITKEKKDKMYIYLQEDGINVDDGLDNCSNDVLEYERILKEFYNYSHKNVRTIIGLWNEKKFEEYYIEITKITTNALNIGANNLYAMLCEQQKNYNVGDMKMVANNVKTIFDEWKKILLYIAEYFKN